jgi:hypothetical protein
MVIKSRFLPKVAFSALRFAAREPAARGDVLFKNLTARLRSFAVSILFSISVISVNQW